MCKFVYWRTRFLGFYSPFTRAWEFAVGALLALVTNQFIRSKSHAEVIAWLGVTLLGGSALLIYGATPFPGPWTLLPVGGTLLLIAAGTHHAPRVNRVLALAIVKVGDWSYPIYLWHWPVKVFAAHLWPESSISPLLGVMLAVLPAVASYHWVEEPLRRFPSLTRPRTVGLLTAVVLPSVICAVALDFAANEYSLPRYKTGAVPITHHGDIDWADFFLYVREKYYPCSDLAVRDNALKSDVEGITRCWQSKPGSRIDVALVGDSHAEHLFLGMAEALPNKNIVYYTRVGLPVDSTDGMSRIINDVAADPAIHTIIVSAEWAARKSGRD